MIDWLKIAFSIILIVDSKKKKTQILGGKLWKNKKGYIELKSGLIHGSEFSVNSESLIFGKDLMVVTESTIFFL